MNQNDNIYELDDETGFITKHNVTLSDEQVVKELNELNYHRIRYRKERDENKSDLYLALDVIEGFKAYQELKHRGYF